MSTTAIQDENTPSELTDGYSFIDSFARAEQHPDTWRYPVLPEQVKPGDILKVGVEKTGSHGERFWCTVLSVSVSSLSVSVDNELIFTGEHGLDYGDVLEIEQRHIVDVWDEGRVLPNATQNHCEGHDENALLCPPRRNNAAIV